MIEDDGVMLTDDWRCPQHGTEDGEGFAEGCAACLRAGALADPECCVENDER